MFTRNGRQNFGVAVLAGVHVQEKIGESAFQAGAQAFVNGKARACDFYRCVEIQNPRAFAQFPVGFRFEIELRRGTPAAHFHVVRGGFAHGYAGVRNIRDGEQEILQLFIQLGDLPID